MLVIHTDGRMERVEKSPDSLAQMQQIVGGYIEFAPMPNCYRSISLVVNEEGRINHLPFNEVATTIYTSLWLSKHRPNELRSGDLTIYGTAILMETEE